MKLRPAERSAILAGDYRALKRDQKPDAKAGDTLVLTWTRGGRQIVDRETGQTVDIPRRPNVWIEFKEPVLREGGWVVKIIGHDDRERHRLLAAGAPSGRRPSPALRTRQRPPEQVPKRGEEVESWTPETERGYVSGGPGALDHLEEVDDEILADFASRAQAKRAAYRQEEHAERETEGEMRRLFNQLRRLQREALKQGVDLTPQLVDWVAEARRAIVKRRNAA